MSRRRRDRTTMSQQPIPAPDEHGGVLVGVTCPACGAQNLTVPLDSITVENPPAGNPPNPLIFMRCPQCQQRRRPFGVDEDKNYHVLRPLVERWRTSAMTRHGENFFIFWPI